MTIKHLVISGGGPVMFRAMGALQKLEEDNFWNRKDTQSIFGTSAGAFVAVIICLNYDWDTILKYFVERPLLPFPHGLLLCRIHLLFSFTA